MKELLLGILVIIIVGIGGLVYRNAAEHPLQAIACPLDALQCPDGTSVARTGTSCTFPACPLPNVSLPDIGIAFAIPAGFNAAEIPDAASVAAYENPTAASTSIARIIIRRYMVDASSTPLATMQQTAIGTPSGLPVGTTSFTSTDIENNRFSIASIERFEGVIDTAYYLKRGTDVLRFDAIDENANWTDANLNITALPAHAALLKLLGTLQAQ
ncbi:MAG: hypothetical protein ACHQU0_01995 [Candidatus Paceibacteria bacterium]